MVLNCPIIPNGAISLAPGDTKQSVANLNLKIYRNANQTFPRTMDVQKGKCVDLEEMRADLRWTQECRMAL